MKNYLSLLVAIATLFLVSCQGKEFTDGLNPDSSTTTTKQMVELIALDSVEITSDGALNFLSPMAYFRNVKRLLNCSDTALDAWEQSVGFNSMRKKLNSILGEACTFTDKQQKAAIVLDYPALVEIGDKGELKPVIEASFYRNILNESGYFYVNGDKYEVTKENLVVTYKDSLESHSFPYQEKTIATRDPGVHKLTGTEGCYSGKIGDLPHFEEVWIETKYKVYRNCIYPPAMLPDRRLLYSIDYYVQIDAWQWKLNANNKWSYYTPTYELYLRNIRATMDGETINRYSVLGEGRSYHMSFTLDMGTYNSDFVELPDNENPDEYWKKLPMLNLQSLHYEAGCSEYPNGINLNYDYRP